MGAFKKSLGQSINGYLNQLRLHHAKVALIDRAKVITVALDPVLDLYRVFMRCLSPIPEKHPAFRREHQRQWRD